MNRASVRNGADISCPQKFSTNTAGFIRTSHGMTQARWSEAQLAQPPLVQHSERSPIAALIKCLSWLLCYSTSLICLWMHLQWFTCLCFWIWLGKWERGSNNEHMLLRHTNSKMCFWAFNMLCSVPLMIPWKKSTRKQGGKHQPRNLATCTE